VRGPRRHAVPNAGGRGAAAAGGLGLTAVLVVVLLQVFGGRGGAAFDLPAGFDTSEVCDTYSPDEG
jgi:hypothetical protein